VILLVLVPIGLLNFGMPGVLSLYEPGELALHLVLGIVSVIAGFVGGSYGGFARLYARIFGIVYILLGAIGFIIPDLIPGVVHLDTGCNFFHLSIGLWGVWAGYFSEPAAEMRTVAQAGA
jgi:hypothetical protein